jgi:hypothetical protein
LDAGILQKTKLLKLYQFPSSGESAGSMWYGGSFRKNIKQTLALLTEMVSEHNDKNLLQKKWLNQLAYQ